MRTVTLSGQDFIVNPLKGKDIKALKAQGFDLMGTPDDPFCSLVHLSLIHI